MKGGRGFTRIYFEEVYQKNTAPGKKMTPTKSSIRTYELSVKHVF